MFVYFWERVSVSGEWAEQGGEKIQSGLCADSREPNLELELTNHKIMTWAKVCHSTGWATQAPPKWLFNGNTLMNRTILGEQSPSKTAHEPDTTHNYSFP